MKTRAFLALALPLILLAPACAQRQAPAAAPSPGSRGPRSVSGEVLDAALVSETFGWVLTQDELLTTSDAGETWRAVPLPGSATPQRAAAALDPQRLWVATILGATVRIDHTDDGGSTWSSSTLSPQGPPGTVTLAIDGGVVAALVQQMTSPQFSIAELFVTVDGVNWSRYEAPVAGSLAVIAPSTVFIAGGVETNELWRSETLGKDWQRMSLGDLGIGAITLGAPRMFSRTDGVLPVTLNTQPRSQVAFLVTTDGGKSWREAGRVTVEANAGPGARVPAAVALPQRWFAIEPGGASVYRTDNAGRGFVQERASGLPQGVVDIRAVSGTVAWARTWTGSCRQGKTDCSLTTGAFLSRDGGRSWQPVVVSNPKPL